MTNARLLVIAGNILFLLGETLIIIGLVQELKLQS